MLNKWDTCIYKKGCLKEEDIFDLYNIQENNVTDSTITEKTPDPLHFHSRLVLILFFYINFCV